MTTTRFILRSLIYYRRTNLGVAAAVAVAVAVIVGALLVGDSVRYSLRRIALARIGQVDHALVGGDRLVTGSLVDRLAVPVENATVVGVLQAPGVAVRAGGRHRVPDVQVIGVTDRFWSLALDPSSTTHPGADGVVISRRLADELGVGVGGEVILRIAKPSALPRDMPIGSEAKRSVSLGATVSAIADDGAMGRFSLAGSQVPPLNAFVPLEALQSATGVGDRVNLVLASGAWTEPRDDAERGMPANDRLHRRFAAAWMLADAGAELRRLPDLPLVELRSKRVFLDAPLVRAADAAAPGGTRSLTYFVNAFETAGGRSTPYSIVSTRETGLADGEIEITRWLAEDLGLREGDPLTLRYYVIGDDGSLLERSSPFNVKRIVETDAPGGDRHLMPEFPGISDAESSREWDPGIPIDLRRIRDKDEDYWDEHRGAPKAFVSLDWARRAWGNRYGDLTQVRWPAAEVGDIDATAARIADALDPRDLGLVWRDIRGPVLAASQSGTDFGGLFIGLSFFIVVAALLLAGLVFVFGMEQRAAQTGAMMALGFTRRRIVAIWLGEGAVLAAIGTAAGVPLGMAYTRAVLWALSTRWAGAVAGTELAFHASGATLATGAGIGFAVAMGAMLWAARGQRHRSPRDLMASRYGVTARPPGRAGWIVGLLSIVGAIALGAAAGASGGAEAAGAFFGAGALMLIGAVMLTRQWIGSMREGRRSPGLFTLAKRNTGRRRGRSLAVVALIASGCFIVIAINAFRHDPAAHAERTTSGTGGFEWFATTTLGIQRSPTDPNEAEELGVDVGNLAGATIVPMRLLAGDDASCLNLNMPRQPPLLGVDPAAMAGRFSFARAVAGAESAWALLDAEPDDDTVPAIVDDAVAMWILKKSVGDTIDYIDDHGRAFKVRIVATLRPSILQGYLVIGESAMKRRYPSVSGYRAMLVDAPDAKAVRDELAFALEDYGASFADAADRLRMFTEVERVYLTIFGALGALGVALGSVGLGLVVSRNVLERRSELGVMQAIGFTRGRLRGLILLEHAGLAAAGIACGSVSAALAVAPALTHAGEGLPLVAVGATLLGVTASAACWIVLAVALAARGRLIDAIRSE